MSYIHSDLQAAVQDDLKDSGFSASRITRYLNYGQLAIFNTHLFKFCEKAFTGSVLAGTTTLSQQTDHQSTIGGVLVDASDTTRRFRLDKTTYLDDTKFFNTYEVPALETAAMPVHWTEFGGVIYFNCPLDVNYTVYQRYYRVPTSLSGASDVPDVPEAFRELLELYAMYRAEKYRGNHDIAATFMQQFEDGLETMTIRFSPATQVELPTMGTGRVRVESDA